ncbi:DNA polymerase III subunit epsilon [Coxiella endosymbiont of Amblyomma americanum]|uniref:DNA polymerase III subunit epsilon n=1 Tax=Coxiella endosymbiont of Amblyomma americanum TaxID=325775 RepID=UPI00057E3B12|nr:DNA polymerase III subunit epsilon [Coxiella endosymbiont of Amblyomma americanum]AJC50468.1 DNA polymerase III subunit epsilon [Coxiella endosymbiont of Amblyomma americanum]AUJ59041.1 DNA polymerase III subunit epsilon [Coxiella-like endosymbiont of Amblyomma americanum]
MRQIILDVETTGLDLDKGHRIIEIGCLEMINRRLTGRSLHFYVNPNRSIEREAFAVHGITENFLANKPAFKDIVDEIIMLLKGSELIIHNASFDVAFLNYEFQLTGRSFKKVIDYCQILDTLTIAQQKHPGQHNSLDALCRRYCVDNSNRHRHGALLDAELLARVYLLMTSGQNQLFAHQDLTSTTQLSQMQMQKLYKDRKPLCVIKANEKETLAHEDFLKLLRKKSRNPIGEF